MTDPREQGCLCGGCGRRYRVDLVVPDVEAGLLCGRCVMDRFEALGEFRAFVLAEA
ncbi:MAG: hypothetical protein KIT58_03140 [Planctomycetota bacterium]|nr:hypothetical protein [Planctomycetota bacterium]